MKEVREIFFWSGKSPIEGIVGERGEGSARRGRAEVGCAPPKVKREKYQIQAGGRRAGKRTRSPCPRD